MQESSRKQHEALIIAISMAVVAGMAIAALLVAWWRHSPAMLASDTGFRAAVAICPPFMLLRAVGGVEDSVLSLVMTEGVIVIANGALYAGMAAFVYWAMTSLGPRKA